MDEPNPKHDLANLIRLNDIFLDKSVELASQGLISKAPDMASLVVNLKKAKEIFALLKNQITQ